jgi:hypothetical protein
MHAWTFAARTIDEVAALLRALGRHRYVREVDHRIHWTVDAALADDPRFLGHAAAFVARLEREPDLDPASRDPSLWRPASIDDVVTVLGIFWDPGPNGIAARVRLRAALSDAGFAIPSHAPFESDPEEPPHPELVLLDWVLHPVDELDPERHAGAIEAMQLAEEEIDVSAPVYQEGACLSAVELLEGAHNGLLVTEWYAWSDGPQSYADYVFRGASKAAKLVEPPAAEGE